MAVSTVEIRLMARKQANDNPDLLHGFVGSLWEVYSHLRFALLAINACLSACSWCRLAELQLSIIFNLEKKSFFLIPVYKTHPPI